MPTTLFLLKRRADYSQDPSYSGSNQIATGMWNSSNFVVQEINKVTDVSADLQILEDANRIDAALVASDPRLVVIEGLWVTPAKMMELKGLYRHRNRKWVVRIHSDIPFLATEGNAMGWIAQYLQMGVVVAPNDPRAHKQLVEYAKVLGLTDDDIASRLPLLMNCFPTDYEQIVPSELDTTNKDTLDIACFGAFRPLKNHLQQALVAIRFAQEQGKGLRFHVNDRQDQGGGSPFKNLTHLFDTLGADFQLVRHGWEDRETFLSSIRGVDLLMQVSLSETFNIVAADATFVGRPVLASDEIPWIYPLTADGTDAEQMLKTLRTLWLSKAFFIQQNRERLTSYAKRSAATWIRYVRSA